MLSLVQDAGRFGYQRYGVSVSGAMDQDALLAGNLLTGNQPGAAAVEVTFGGASFKVDQNTVVAITGADLQATVDGTQAPVWESFIAPSGSALTFSAPANGMRSYICVAGGFDTSPVLRSRSTHTGSGIGGLTGGPLASGDVLPIGEPAESAAPGLSLPATLRPDYTDGITVRVVPGPQDDAFTAAGLKTFFSSAYAVTDKSDRQGVRLEGPKIEAKDGRYDIVSDAVPVGSIQVPGDGMPIALLADRQTTGGYAKIGVVASVDLPKLAQAMPGATIKFEPITVDEARGALIERRSSLVQADLLAGWTELSDEVRTGGLDKSIRLGFRADQLRDPDGAFVTAVINGEHVSVRARQS